jgi:hypothetical protein
MAQANDDNIWKLYARALSILEGRSNGHALPIVRMLAARRFPPAVNLLSDYVPDQEALRQLRRAARSGDAISAYNLAITYRNRGDIQNYRLALFQAAKLDDDVRVELKAFQTRFPETIMRKFNRLKSSRS